MTIDPYASHFPVLSACIRLFPGTPLEIGTGFYSTPLIQAVEGESVEPDQQWYKKVKQFYPHVRPVDGWTPTRQYSFIFVDSSPERGGKPGEVDRVGWVRKLRENSSIFILHDEQEAFASVYDDFQEYLIYKQDFPRTVVLSDKSLTDLQQYLENP